MIAKAAMADGKGSFVIDDIEVSLRSILITFRFVKSIFTLGKIIMP